MPQMALRSPYSDFTSRSNVMTHFNWEKAKIYHMLDWMLEDELAEMLEAERLAIQEWEG